MDVDGDRAAVSIVGADLSQLVGQRGEVLDALQELTRLAVYRETGERSRLMLDISGYRADQRARLVELAQASVAAGQGVRGARLARPDVAVRAQGRPRRGGRGRSDLGVRGRRAPPVRGDPARLSRLPLGDVSRETPAAPPRGTAGVRRGAACRWPSGTPSCWPTEGVAARPDRPARGAPAVGPAPAELRRPRASSSPRARRWPTSAPARVCPAWCWRSRGPTCGSRWSSHCCGGPASSSEAVDGSGCGQVEVLRGARRGRSAATGRSTW